jgi:hypothetical protein
MNWQDLAATSHYQTAVAVADELRAGRVPSLTRETVEQMWDRCFAAAKRQAEVETQAEVLTPMLTWEEVFEEDYGMPKSGSARKKARRKRGKRRTTDS